MSKSAVMVFSKKEEDGWKWGEHKVSNLGIDFACNGALDVHLKRVPIMVGKR